MSAQIKTFPPSRIKRMIAPNEPTALYVALLMTNMPDEEFCKLQDAIIAAADSDIDCDALSRGLMEATHFVEE